MRHNDFPGRLALSTFVPPGSCYHVARIEQRPGNAVGVHTHDFAELFWIESGRGTHLINGQRQPLQRGDMVLIRPEDAHGFRDFRGESARDDKYVMVNVAFAEETLSFLRERYFADQPWPWQGAELPAHYVLSHDAQARLNEWAASLSMASQTRLELETFLMSVLHLLSKPALPLRNVQAMDRKGQRLPDWLEHALVRCSEPPHLARGVGELAHLAGRCPEHLNRVVRRYTGRTATAIINELRLEYAARQLSMTSRPILDIAADCGLNSLSHFHQLFRERYGLSPRRYRVHQQSIA